jgi:hypothetical protein
MTPMYADRVVLEIPYALWNAAPERFRQAVQRVHTRGRYTKAGIEVEIANYRVEELMGYLPTAETK